jgi:catechol 2,3-dioxygenase-like lactoylglutathione lyase family enzyme
MRRFARKPGAAEEVQMHKPVDLSQAAFRIADADKSATFYEKVLGLKRLPRPDFSFKGMWYGIGSGQIHLIVSKKHDGPDPTGPHIAIEVEDLDATKASLREMGVPFLDGDTMSMRSELKDEDRRRLGRQIWVLDPDGNTVELRKSEM